MYYNMNLVALFNFPHHHVNLNWRRFHIPRHQKEGRRCFLDVHMSILFIIMLYWRDGLHHSLIWHDAPGWTARLMVYLWRQPTGGLRTWAFGGVFGLSCLHFCVLLAEIGKLSRLGLGGFAIVEAPCTNFEHVISNKDLLQPSTN